MDLEQRLNKQVEGEFKGVLFYDEIIEEMVRQKDTIKDVDKYIDTLRNIQKQQSIHTLELVDMSMDLGFKEPAIVQQLEDFLKIKEY